MDELRRYLEEHSALFIAIASVLSAVATVIGLWISWRRLKKDRNELAEEVGNLRFKLGEGDARAKQLEQDCTTAHNETLAVQAELKNSQDTAQQKEIQLTEALESAKDEVTKLKGGKDSASRHIKRMLKLEGQLWQERVPARAPS
jgi:chromosome segregation ATPase